MGDPIDHVIKLAQKCVEQVPVVVLGSGASAQYGIGGMGALQKHLLASVKPADAKEEEVWTQFSAEYRTIVGDGIRHLRIAGPTDLDQGKEIKDGVIFLGGVKVSNNRSTPHPALSSFGPPTSDFGATSKERENYFVGRLPRVGPCRTGHVPTLGLISVTR